AVHTIRQNSIKFSSFELVYRRSPKREYQQTKSDTGTYEEKLWAYIIRDISRLQLIRRKTAVFIEKAQERQQKRQNEKIIGETLNIGDEVLPYRDTVEASWSTKLELKWNGPYR